MRIFKYQTEDEANIIIERETSQGQTLVEVQNITEGNFLAFSDKEVMNSYDIQEQFLILMDAVATIYETISGGTTV